MAISSSVPLAERLRPLSLDDLVGQEHLTGKNSILRRSISQGVIPSMILWGPPELVKQPLHILFPKPYKNRSTSYLQFSSGVKDVREIIELAKKQPGSVLFIDEIHRFNKGQQDALLGAVEKGTIILIGATTENPSFEVNSALLSRCQVYVLKPLSKEALEGLLKNAIETDAELKSKKIFLKETEALIRISGG
jgi:putative ATPase